MPTEHLEDNYDGEFAEDSNSNSLMSLFKDRWSRLVIGILFANMMFFGLPFIMAGKRASNDKITQSYERVFPSGGAFMVEWVLFMVIVAIALYHWDKSILKPIFAFFAKLFSPSIAFFIFASGMMALMVALKHYIEQYL